MFPVEIFRSTIEKFVAILDQFQIRFHLRGGITSAAYGEPRMTQDIDFVVDPRGLAEYLEEVVRALKSAEFLFEESSVRSAVREGEMFQLLDTHEALKLDIYARELIKDELDRSELLEVFEGLTLPLASRIDAAGSKLVWISKGSHKSRRDLRHIFRTSDPTMRLAIRNLATDLKLPLLLNEVLAESDEIS
jgi:Nucleotidyl transferase AbiEii toxin, Type IV TA system